MLAGVCPLPPDADVIGFYFGIKCGNEFGHRDFSHALTFPCLRALASCRSLFGRAAIEQALVVDAHSHSSLL